MRKMVGVTAAAAAGLATFLARAKVAASAIWRRAGARVGGLSKTPGLTALQSRRLLLVTAAAATTVVVVTSPGASTRTQAQSVISGGTMGGVMAVNEDAAGTLVPQVSIDSTVTNVVDMRIGPPVESVFTGGQAVLGLTADGNVYGWGWSGGGQLGIGQTGLFYDPTISASGSQWASVTSGPNHSAILRSDGALFSAGYNGSGQVGDGTTSQRTTWVPVSAGATWTAVSAGNDHTLALKSDGSLWAWGGNSWGQLGLGTTGGAYYAPTRVGTANDWVDIDAGSLYSLARKSDGTLWAWGYNGLGMLGVGDTNSRTSPAQVSVGTTYTAMEAAANGNWSFAIKSDGTLWGWGYSSVGVGDGVLTARTSPVQVAAGKTFKEVASEYQHALAIASDDTLWSWGAAQMGELGQGTISVDGTLPAQVGTSSGWSSPTAGTWTSFAKRGGNLYSWGDTQGTALLDAYPGSSVPATLTTGWGPYGAHQPWTLGSADGTHTVWAVYRDAGGATVIATDTIVADFSQPSGTMSLNVGGLYSNSTTLTVSSSITNVVDMRVESGSWQAYTPVVQLKLSAGDGLRSVSVDYRDEWGRITSLTDTITIDTAPPSGTVVLNQGAESTKFGTVIASSSVDAAAMRTNPALGFTKVAVTGSTTLGIRTDGTLWGAGNNSYGMLGDSAGASAPGYRPYFIQSAQSIAKTWKDVAVGGSYVVAVATDGTLWGWGNTSYGFGDNSTYHPYPTRIDNVGTSWNKVWANGGVAAALDNSGALYMWGYNSDGQLGDGTQTNRNVRTRVGTASDYFKDVSISYWSTMAIKADGTLWGWGYNGGGGLGLGNTVTPQKSPVKVGTASTWAQIGHGGSSSAAIRTDGTLWTWGSNGQGSLGDGSAAAGRNAPAQVGAATNWKQVSNNNGSVVALKTDGTVWGWGYNSQGQVGDGSITNRATPWRVGQALDWQSVVTANSSSYAIKTDGSLWAWGLNQTAGAFGDGVTNTRWVYPVLCDFEAYSPTKKITLTGGDGAKTTSILFRDAAGNTSTITDDIVRDSGLTSGTVTVNGGAVFATNPSVTLTSSVPYAVNMRIAAPVRSVSSGGNFTMFVGEDGVLWGTGNNSYGSMGTGVTGFDTYPKPAFSARGWTDVSAGDYYTLALKGSELWAAGYNWYGMLGDGTTTNQVNPVLIPGSWKQVAAGYLQSAGIQNDSTLWTWGNNGYGQLGLGSYSGRTAPTQVSGSWKQIANSQGYFMMGVTTGGSLYAWGDNTYGQLGQNNKTSRTSAVLVGTAGEWDSVAVGQYHTVGLKKDGTLWAWGRNNVGQAGRSDITTEVLSPYQIGIGFSEIAAGSQHSLARKSDGTLWTFGDNGWGQLGLGDNYVRREPVLVGGDWARIDAFGTNSTGIKTDGTVWACGQGGSGQLGQSNSSNQNAFVQMPPAWGAYATSSAVTVPYALGNVRIYGQYRDIAGNVVPLYDDILFDSTPPVTTLVGAPTGWSTNSPVTLSVSAEDSYTAIAQTSYSINGGPTLVYSGPFQISTPGTNTVAFSSRDAAGNSETTKTATVRIDAVGPITSSDMSAGWTSRGTVTLTGADLTSGIANTFYRLDGSAVTTYTAPITLSDGVHALSYWSVDVAGNVEASHDATAMVDRVSPTSSSSAIPAGWVASDVGVTLTGTDDRAGLAGIRYQVDSAAVESYTTELVITNGEHVLQWAAVDAAGNSEATQTATIKVDTASPTSSTNVDSLWHAATYPISISAADGESGVAATFYRINGLETNVYAGGFLWADEGTSTLEYWSVDGVGNLESTRVAQILLDFTPPSTTASGVPSGVIDRDARVSLSSTDAGSGVAHIWYRVNGGEKRPYLPEQEAIVISKSGTTTVEYWGEDGVGREEARKTFSVTITPPTGGSAIGAKNAACLECHSSPSIPGRPMNFDVAPVDRTSACPQCHFNGLVYTHPYHHSGGNCAVCHGAGWGPSMLSAAPSVVTTAGAFVAGGSKDVDAFTLHVIHANPRWPSGVSKPSSVCGSCHAVAACEACHAGAIPAGHAIHSATGDSSYPARSPVSLRQGSGVPLGNQTVDSVFTQPRQCSASECHNTPGLVSAAPTLREDYSHAAVGATPANVVYKTGVWRQSTGSAYTGGQRSISYTVGSTLSIAFTGTKVAFVADKSSNLGIARIALDGAQVATVDQYAATTRNQVVLWTSSELAGSEHTITISPTGLKNPAATTTYISVDQFQIWNTPPTSVAPYCSTSCHPDRVASHGYADIDHVADVSGSIEPLSGATCASCHSMDLLTEHERVGSVSKGGSCATCHGDPRGTFSAWNQTCRQAGCHTPGTSQEMHGRLPSAHNVSLSTRTACTRNCHQSVIPTEHARIGATRVAVTCVQCHTSAEYTGAARVVSFNGTCAACHTVGHSQASAGNDLCFDCHSTDGQAEITAVGAVGTFAATAGDHEAGYAASAHGSSVVAGNNGGVDSGIVCEACHDHNTMDADGPTRFRTSGSALDRKDLCFACHSRSGVETRTATPNTWNGRDVAEEFDRASSHPVEPTVAMSRLETTRTVFAQYRQAEFALDNAFQTSPFSLSGVGLQWASYLESPAPAMRLYLQPGWNNALYQYDPARDQWGTDRYNPPAPPYSSGYSGQTSAVTIGNEIYFASYGTRAKYTPANGVVNGSWTAATGLPDYPGSDSDLALDSAHGKVYYTGHSYNLYTWDLVTDSMSTFGIQDTLGNGLTLWDESAIAYAPEFDRLFVISNSAYASPVNGSLLFLDSPSTASGTMVFTDTGMKIARETVQPIAFNRLKRISRNGHDYLVFLGIDENGTLVTQVLDNLGSGTPQAADVASYPFGGENASYRVTVEWDGGEYLYAYRQGGEFTRIRIPSDPVNDVWGAWESITPPPVGGYGGAIGFATATPTPYTVDGYYRSGTISAEVELSKSAREWDRVEWVGATPAGTALSLSVEGWDGSAWSQLPGMVGLSGGSADLSGVNGATYRKVRLKATLSSTIDNATPSLYQWVVSERVPGGDGRNVASLTCSSCHDAHKVGVGAGVWDPARVSDPLNTKAQPTTTTGFCLRCHSIFATNPGRSATELVPYAISFGYQSGLFPGWDKGSSQFGFATSGHYTTVGTKALCENCHDPHGSNNPRLTAWTKPASFPGGADGSRDNTSAAGLEENLCLQCHGNGTTGRQAPGAPDIASTIFSAYGHNLNPAGAHSDTETVAGIQARRHAECVDCHDPHAAQAGTHVQGLSVAGNAVRGAIGVRPTWSSTQMSTPTTLTPVRMGSRGDEPEAYLCLKCHSGTEGLPSFETRSNGSTYTPTDIAAEFNPNNASFHNVLGVGGMKTSFNVFGVDYSWSRPADNQYLKTGWTSDSKLTCTDCHTSGSMAAAKGPHGSSVQYMIDPAYPADYRLAQLDFRESDGVYPSGQLLCTKCHVFNRTQNTAHGTSSLILGPVPIHTREYSGSDTHAMRCVSCHIKIPHGWKRPRLIGYKTDAEPYRTQSGIYRGELQAISLKNHSPNSWNMGDCQACGVWAHSYGFTPWP